MARYVLQQIEAELQRQNELWEEQNHHPAFWLAILIEEVGEVAKAIVDGHLKEARAELVQVAAVAASAIESLNRNELRGG